MDHFFSVNRHNNRCLDREALLHTLNILQKLGFISLRLHVGKAVHACDEGILAAIIAIRDASDFAVEIDPEPLSHMNATCPNPADAIPNPALPAANAPQTDMQIPRIGSAADTKHALIKSCAAWGIPISTVLRLDATENAEDLIHRFFCLGQPGSSIRISVSFRPTQDASGDPKHPRSSLWQLARTIAVARLIRPQAQIFISDANHESLPLWVLAGGGNRVVGSLTAWNNSVLQSGMEAIPVTKSVSIHDGRNIQKQIAQDMGIPLGFCSPTPLLPAQNRRLFVGCPKH
jgi:biotin synthase